MFQVIEGRQSERYDHFADHEFDSCVATDTRLMGAVALKVCWRSRENRRDRFFQLIHLDFSEYGIDDYIEYFTSPDMIDYGTIFSMRELNEEWDRISGSLGGMQVTIPLSAAVSLIDQALAANEEHWRDHPEDLQDYRRQVLPRIEMMRAQAEAPADPVEAMTLVCPKRLTAYETINYFLMRLCDRDFPAAGLLTTMSEEALRVHPLASHGLMTLSRNRITQDRKAGLTGGAALYHCALVAECDRYPGYRYARASLTLIPAPGKKQFLVTQCECQADQSISGFEAAMQLSQPEYITAYRLNVPPEEFNLDSSPMASRALTVQVPNGLAFMLYNSGNGHVDTRDYYLSHDLYGAYLITTRGQLIVMSGELIKIDLMERDLAPLIVTGTMDLIGHYKFTSQVFQSFSQMQDVLFEDIIK
ncbi:MAG: hypothetical protein IJH75_07520 [Mogibacterium sp.]|nr:hypothetical protein [Mogibacterium sp.]